MKLLLETLGTDVLCEEILLFLSYHDLSRLEWQFNNRKKKNDEKGDRDFANHCLVMQQKLTHDLHVAADASDIDSIEVLFNNYRVPLYGKEFETVISFFHRTQESQDVAVFRRLLETVDFGDEYHINVRFWNGMSYSLPEVFTLYRSSDINEIYIPSPTEPWKLKTWDEVFNAMAEKEAREVYDQLD